MRMEGGDSGDSAQSLRLGTGGFGKRLGRLRLVADGVGHSQLGHDVQAPRRPARGGELHELNISGTRRRSGTGQRGAGAHVYPLSENHQRVRHNREVSRPGHRLFEQGAAQKNEGRAERACALKRALPNF